MCVGHQTPGYLFRVGPGVSYGVSKLDPEEGEDEVENRWETLARMRYPVPVYSRGENLRY